MTKKEDDSGCLTPQESEGLHSIGPRSFLDMGKAYENKKAGHGPAFASSLLLKASLTLKNSGSVARDHLALERTFLAYVRTSLTIVTVGVGLFQLFISSRPATGTTVTTPGAVDMHRLGIVIRVLAPSTILLGMAVLTIGAWRYFTTQVALTTGVFPAPRLSSFAIAATLMVLALTMFCALLSVHL